MLRNMVGKALRSGKDAGGDDRPAGGSPLGIRRRLREALGHNGSAAPVVPPSEPEPPAAPTPPAEPEPPAAPERYAAPASPPLSSIAAAIASGGAAATESQVRDTSRVDLGTSDVDGDLHTAADGSAYWGEIDNESARAKAAGKTLIVDQWECISCGTCVENTAAVFVLPDDAKAIAVRQVGPMDLIQDAMDACPVACIHWTETPDEFEQLNDRDGNTLSE